MPPNGPIIPGEEFRNLINSADINSFASLANEAANTKKKGAGRDLIGRRNALLSSYDPYQRYKVGQTYYGHRNLRASDEGSLWDYNASDPNQFINLIDDDDTQFLQGLADDTGSGGGGGSGGGAGGGGTDGGNNTGGFNAAEFQQQMQNMINQLLQSQQGQFNSALNSFRGSAPTLSVGSVSTQQGTPSARASARNSGGLVSTLAARRGRRAGARPRRYF